MEMMSAAKAARLRATKLKLCDSLAGYLEELAPKTDAGPDAVRRQARRAAGARTRTAVAEWVAGRVACRLLGRLQERR